MLCCVSFAVIGAAWVPQSTAEETAQDRQLSEARALLRAGRDDIIEIEMQLTADEKVRFWPLYQAYVADVDVLRDRYAAMIVGYLKAYDAGEISDDYARELLDDWLDYKKDLLKVRERYLRKFRKVLSSRQVVLFYQLENKMDVEIEAELAAVVPLMDTI
jgi:hypothetical protein